MSTTTIDFDTVAGNETTTGKSTFDRLVEHRTRRGEASVKAYLARLSDTSLPDLGFKPDHIEAIRATGTIPASFWR